MRILFTLARIAVNQVQSSLHDDAAPTEYSFVLVDLECHAPVAKNRNQLATWLSPSVEPTFVVGVVDRNDVDMVVQSESESPHHVSSKQEVAVAWLETADGRKHRERIAHALLEVKDCWSSRGNAGPTGASTAWKTSSEIGDVRVT